MDDVENMFFVKEKTIKEQCYHSTVGVGERRKTAGLKMAADWGQVDLTDLCFQFLRDPDIFFRKLQHPPAKTVLHFSSEHRN